MTGRTSPTLRPCGDLAVLVELDDLHQVLALHAALEAARAGASPGALAGVVDTVPAARTLLVIARSPAELGPVRAATAALAAELAADLASGRPPATGAAGREPLPGAEVEIGVVYDGEDLAEVAALTGLTLEEVVAAHTRTPWTAGFAGFAPGFAYLVDGDPRLQVPRRQEPRTSVPAGAVALAGPFSGVYPRASPGGWQIIGHTAAVLWDPDREPPALLQPGRRVRFVALGGGR